MAISSTTTSSCSRARSNAVPTRASRITPTRSTEPPGWGVAPGGLAKVRIRYENQPGHHQQRACQHARPPAKWLRGRLSARAVNGHTPPTSN